jgi:drug/metabolite transporter (DMT)-like permease
MMDGMMDPSPKTLLVGALGVGASFWLWWYGCKTLNSGTLGIVAFCAVIVAVIASSGGPPTRPL